MFAQVADAAAFSGPAPATAQVLASPSSPWRSRPTPSTSTSRSAHGERDGRLGRLHVRLDRLPCGCSSTAPSATCAFGSSGNFLVTVHAYDSFQVETSVARAYVTVSSDPVVLLTPVTPSVDLGQTAKFAVTVTGGAPGYAFAFLNLPAGCASSNAAHLTCVPTAVGSSSNLSVAVTDRNNWTVDVALNFSVYSDPTLALRVTPNPVALGDSVEFVAAVTGGAPGGVHVVEPSRRLRGHAVSDDLLHAGPGRGDHGQRHGDRRRRLHGERHRGDLGRRAPAVLSGTTSLLLVGLVAVAVVAAVAVLLVAPTGRADPPPTRSPPPAGAKD